MILVGNRILNKRKKNTKLKKNQRQGVEKKKMSIGIRVEQLIRMRVVGLNL